VKFPVALFVEITVHGPPGAKARCTFMRMEPAIRQRLASNSLGREHGEKAAGAKNFVGRP